MNTSQLITYLTNLINENARHVRRIVPWFGFVFAGIENLPQVSNLRLHHSRQIAFTYRGLDYKVRYNHRVKQTGFCRGGVEIVELKGREDGRIVMRITSLKEAEMLYLQLRTRLDAFIATA